MISRIIGEVTSSVCSFLGGHHFVTNSSGITYCTHCGKVLKK